MHIKPLLCQFNINETPIFMFMLDYYTNSSRTMATPVPETPSSINSTLQNAVYCRGHQWHKHTIDPKYEVWFWLTVGVCTLVLSIGAILNCLVIYLSNQKLLTGTLRHLNTVVKHLAVSDLCWGIVGCPVALALFRKGNI